MKNFLLYFTIIILSFQYFDILGTTNQNENYPNNKSDIDTVTHQSTINQSQLQESKDIKNNADINQSSLIAVRITADRKEYTEFESIEIWGFVNGSGSQLIKLVLELRDSNNILIHNASRIVNNGNFTFLLQTGKLGMYNVTVKAIQGTNYEVVKTSLKVVSIFDTNIAKFLYLSLGFVGALLVLITIGIKNCLLDEILRFVFLSGIVASLLASLLFADIQFGKQSPIGLIKEPSNEKNIEEWVFNIGNALKIPIYVVVFGLIGGYIRYLYKTSKLIDELKDKNKLNKSKSKNSNNQSPDKNNVDINNVEVERDKNSHLEREDKIRIIFYESLRDIALFFLAPILSVAVYFLLLASGLSGVNSIYTLAVISFTVGLVTEDIIQKLIKFTLQKPSTNSKTNNSNVTKT